MNGPASAETVRAAQDALLEDRAEAERRAAGQRQRRALLARTSAAEISSSPLPSRAAQASEALAALDELVTSTQATHAEQLAALEAATARAVEEATRDADADIARIDSDMANVQRAVSLAGAMQTIDENLISA